MSPTTTTNRNGEKMSNFRKQITNITRVRRLFAAAFVLACAFGTVRYAAAEQTTSLTTSSLITPEAGNSAFLVGHAQGTQGYVCLPTSTGASWTVNGARPEATLFTTIFGQA